MKPDWTPVFSRARKFLQTPNLSLALHLISCKIRILRAELAVGLAPVGGLWLCRRRLPLCNSRQSKCLPRPCLLSLFVLPSVLRMHVCSFKFCKGGGDCQRQAFFFFLWAEKAQRRAHPPSTYSRVKLQCIIDLHFRALPWGLKEQIDFFPNRDQRPWRLKTQMEGN